MDGGTLVVINGPRFSTRAESLLARRRRAGRVVGMTAVPEASIARELALCYTSIALVTDLDAGLEHGRESPTTRCCACSPHNVEGSRACSSTSCRAARPTTTAACRHALDGLRLPFDLP